MQKTAAKPMTFEGGTALFVSRFKNYACFPNGVPHRVVGSDRKTAHVPAWRAEFTNNTLHVADPKNVRDLLNYTGHFDDSKDGFTLDPGCIPPDIRQFWPNLSTENRRRIALGLVDGLSSEECFALVDPADMRKAEPEARTQQELVCPVSGCLAAPLRGPSATADLLVHLRVSHPDYEPEENVGEVA